VARVLSVGDKSDW